MANKLAKQIELRAEASTRDVFECVSHSVQTMGLLVSDPLAAVRYADHIQHIASYQMKLLEAMEIMGRVRESMRIISENWDDPPVMGGGKCL